MTNALVIYPDGRLEERDVDFPAIQELCGGYVQVVDFGDFDGERADAWMDEEGKLAVPPRELNAIATGLLIRAGGIPGDVVVGTVVVTGAPDREGDHTDVPVGFVEKVRRIAAGLARVEASGELHPTGRT